MTGPSLLCCLFLLLCGVFGDTDEVTVSVMEGDSVTLHIKPEETQGTVKLWWTFNSEETAIVFLDKEINETINDDTRFKDRLQLDVVSGSLTITNSRTTDSGVYTLEIMRMSGDPIYKRFRVTVSEVISVPVSVIVGDSVTLQTDVKIQTDDVIQWKFKGDIIADLTGRVHDERFRNCEVKRQTGDLIITDIRTDQSGDYEMKINGGRLQKIFSVNVKGVFGDTDEVTVSVMKGDSLTLHIKPEETQRYDRLWWRFNSEETAIASLDKETSKIRYYDDDKRFKDRLQLDVVSGSLTITNSRTTDSGVYTLEIMRLSGDPIYKRFRVTVSEVKTVSEGDYVTLPTDVKIQRSDRIEWKFEGDIIANLTGRVHDERFRNCEVKPQTGNLIITHIRRDQSGDYELKINSRGFISHRRFSVSVDAGLSSGDVAAICLAVLLVIAAAAGVILYCRYQKKLQDKAPEQAKPNE